MEQPLIETDQEILIVRIYRSLVNKIGRRNRVVKEYIKRTAAVTQHFNSLEKYTFPVLEHMFRSDKIDVNTYVMLMYSFLDPLKEKFHDDYKRWLLVNHADLSAVYVERQVVKIEMAIHDLEIKINKTVDHGPLRVA